MMYPENFRAELETIINKHSMENGSNTPDFILAKYLSGCLKVFDAAVARRDDWYGIAPVPGADWRSSPPSLPQASGEKK